MRLHRFLPAAILVLGFAGPSYADLILFSNLGQPDNGTAGFDETRTRLATDFLTDGTPRTITSITARMGNTGFISHTVTFSIFTDGGGIPGTLVAIFGTPATLPAGNSGDFTATSSGIDLQANTAYWLVGQTDETPLLGSVTWRFDLDEGTDAGNPFSTVPGTQFQRSPNGGANWINGDTGNFMFELQGVTTVPEPSSLILLGLTAAGVAGWRWRKRRAA